MTNVSPKKKLYMDRIKLNDEIQTGQMELEELTPDKISISEKPSMN